MKILVAYSSLTGNTKKVAQAVADALGDAADLKPVAEAGDAAGYDKVIAGFWVDKSTADKAAADFLAQLHGKQVALFATMGAYPEPPYRDKCLDAAAALVPADNKVLAAGFACMGKIDPKLIEMFKKLPADHPHAMTPEREARHKEAAKHPDEADLAAAAAFARSALAEFNK